MVLYNIKSEKCKIKKVNYLGWGEERGGERILKPLFLRISGNIFFHSKKLIVSRKPHKGQRFNVKTHTVLSSNLINFK